MYFVLISVLDNDDVKIKIWYLLLRILGFIGEIEKLVVEFFLIEM